MKSTAKIITTLVLIFGLLTPKIVSAQNQNLIKVYGKILNGKKSDVIVFRAVENDWKIIRTMRLRSRYDLELNLNYEHYVVFRRKDGLVKAIYVKKSAPGYSKMNFNVSFDDFNTDHIVLYRNKYNASFNYKVVKKSNQKIEMNTNKMEELVIAE